jgi:hypothetical protein
MGEAAISVNMGVLFFVIENEIPEFVGIFPVIITGNIGM